MDGVGGGKATYGIDRLLSGGDIAVAVKKKYSRCFVGIWVAVRTPHLEYKGPVEYGGIRGDSDRGSHILRVIGGGENRYIDGQTAGNDESGRDVVHWRSAR